MFTVKDDLELIVHSLDRSLKEVHLYPLGDLHLDSELFDLSLWEKWKLQVINDPLGYVGFVGDIFDNTLKNSKGNSYANIGRTRDSKRWFANEMLPLKDRILGGTDGNHEYRSVYASDDSPLYDVMCKLDLEDYYRENMAFIKISLGEKNAERQFTYVVVLAHGGFERKTNTFSYAIDGMDVFITGHDHKPKNNFPAKIKIDPHNNKVTTVGLIHATVPSFQRTGGYALKGMYMPQDNDRIPMITLDGTKKYTSITWI